MFLSIIYMSTFVVIVVAVVAGAAIYKIDKSDDRNDQ